MLVFLSAWLEKHVNRKRLFFLFAAYAAILAVMSFVFIPAICANTGGMKIFDLKLWSYGMDYAVAFKNAMGDFGRDIYLQTQLPLDMIYPLVYGLMYIALANKIYNKINLPIFLIVTILCLSDYTENILSYIILIPDNISTAVVSAASVFTDIKTVFLCFTWAALAFGWVCRMLKNKIRS